jgi:hypothetical protein
MEVKRTYVLKSNGVFQDGKVHFAGRFPPSHADFTNNSSWEKPVKMSRAESCPVNTMELNEVPMHLQEQFIEKLVEKRHYHPLILGRISINFNILVSL